MLEENIGYNVSPNEWDSFPSLGREGTYITGKQALTDVLGDLGPNTEITISKETARQLEVELGLQKDAIQNGF